MLTQGAAPDPAAQHHCCNFSTISLQFSMFKTSVSFDLLFRVEVHCCVSPVQCVIADCNLMQLPFTRCIVPTGAIEFKYEGGLRMSYQKLLAVSYG